jgi:Sulfatase-modifying factor enzyme 1
MDDRPRQVLKQLLAQYGLVLCDQPSRCRGLLLDELEGACEAEVNTLLLALQYGIIEELREVAGPQIPELLLSQLVQKLRRRVPLDGSAANWAVEVWAEALALCLSALPLSSLPPVSSPYSAASSLPSLSGRHTLQQHIPRTSRSTSACSLPPLPIPSPTWHNSLGMEFVLIPAGTFQMGSNDSDNYGNDKPMHTVRITQPFYLGKYEVTQGQWQAVMGNNPSKFTGDPNRPVENVSWDDRLEGQTG